MGLISIIRARTLRPQFVLAALFAAIAVAVVPLAILTSREHAYQRQVAAANVLKDRDAPFWCDINFNRGDGGDPDFLGFNKEILERSDVVTKIDIRGDDGATLSDAQVSAILCFPELKELGISKCGVTDMQLAELSRLHLLEDFALIDSTFAAAGLRHLTAMRSLRVLNIFGTSVTDAALAHVAALRELELLWLVDTKVTDNGLRYVGKLRSLTKLGLVETRITDNGLRYVGKLRSLAVLGLGKTRITDAGMLHLGGLTRLKSLDLHNDAIGDEALRYLTPLPRLTHLDLMATRVTDDGLKTLRRFRALENISLQRCEISDAGLIHLADVPSLRQVNVYFAKFVTAAGVARLQRLRPDLTVDWGPE